MYIKKAELKDKEQALAILTETANWLNQKGSQQWQDILDGKDRHGLGKAVEKGEVYFYYNRENRIIGMFAAWSQPSAWDQKLWKDADKIQQAIYVHRLIIRPEYRGNNYGELLMNDIKKHFREHFRELRLDCLAENKYLNEFYLKNGFKLVETVKNEGNMQFNLLIFELN